MKRAFFVLVFAAIAWAEDHTGVVRNLSENKFEPVPGLPACMMGSVSNGDPAKGPSVVLFRAAKGCLVPWHWHTPTEQLMIVSGKARLEMKDGKTVVLGPGGYAKLPSKHVHQFSCASACSGFVHSDAAFDIHYVDEGGKEIPLETALKGKKPVS